MTAIAPAHAASAPALGATFGEVLSRILLEDPHCRRLWARQGVRTARSALHQAAIARVLAQWLWEAGEAAESDRDLPRRLKDTVSRALVATRVSPRTYRLFVDAFEMTTQQQDELWQALSG